MQKDNRLQLYLSGNMSSTAKLSLDDRGAAKKNNHKGKWKHHNTGELSATIL